MKRVRQLLCLLGLVACLSHIACLPCGGAPVVGSLNVCATFKDKSGAIILPDKVTYLYAGQTQEVRPSDAGDDKYCFVLSGSGQTTLTATWKGETKTKEVSDPSYDGCSSSSVTAELSFSN